MTIPDRNAREAAILSRLTEAQISRRKMMIGALASGALFTSLGARRLDAFAQASPVASPDVQMYDGPLAADQDRMQELCDELHKLGIELKDFFTGLVDFPGELDGEPVLFCWLLGEERVEYFHTAAEGFGGRRPIPVPVHA